MLPPSASDRIVNGFFWYVVPMIFSGASSLATAVPIDTASLSADVGRALDELRDSGATGPAMRFTALKPASV